MLQVDYGIHLSEPLIVMSKVLEATQSVVTSL